MQYLTNEGLSDDAKSVFSQPTSSLAACLEDLFTCMLEGEFAEAAWERAVVKDEAWLPREACRCIEEHWEDAATIAAALKIIVLCCKLAPIWWRSSGSSCFALNFFRVTTRCLSCHDHSDSQLEQVIQMSLLAADEALCVFDGGNVGEDEWDPKVIGTFFSLLLECAHTVGTEEILVQTVHALAHAASLFKTYGGEVMFDRISNENLSNLQDLVLHELNMAENTNSARQLIILLEQVLSKAMWYTNNVRIIIDITIRECANLPAGESLRIDYLNLLSLTVAGERWAQSAERYKEDQLTKVLSDLANSSIQPQVRTLSGNILLDMRR